MRGPGLDRLHEIADVIYDPFIEHTPLKLHSEEDLAKRLAEEGATIVISEADKIAGPVLDQPLAVIGSTRGDPTNVDIPAATAKGIPVLRAPGRNANAVAEITLALLFAANRHVVAADRDVRDGQIYKDGTIPYQRFRAWELAGRTAGLVGLGAIGRALKWRLEGVGMTVIAYDPYADDATHSLDDLLAQSDVVSMHAPVTDDTRGMIGAAQFAQMKDGAIYLNAARAALHDTDALVDALTSGKLFAAGLDHFEHEWLDPAAPLAQLSNVVLTPHIGGATYDTEGNHARMIADDIAAVLTGQMPVNCVNPEVLEGR
ncbi:MAG: D-3-phosphoglycerate dehydrogenase / 2-oxoglutarate reductase [Frankiales bacterium]|jgi:D-3-phosphoglycerate dehydrogenase|nr:D-3-phosphoglycerate dehydrogenase / 2-oxoglutarate reductase [Frankiales bacterium]